MPAGYNSHYLCRRESSKQHRHWIPKENAVMKGTIPMCPDCGRRLSASPKNSKFKKGRKPWEIVIDDTHRNTRKRGQTYPHCLHCKREMRYMLELEAKGRRGVFECMGCGCIFAWVSSFPMNKTWLTLVHGSPKCRTLIKKHIPMLIRKIRKRKRRKRK